jgi:hypothetical protein
VPFVIVCHGLTAPRPDRQSRLGTVERSISTPQGARHYGSAVNPSPRRRG